MEIIKTENQIKFCPKIDQDVVQNTVVHFNTNNKFSCEVVCLNNDRMIQMQLKAQTMRYQIQQELTKTKETKPRSRMWQRQPLQVLCLTAVSSKKARRGRSEHLPFPSPSASALKAHRYCHPQEQQFIKYILPAAHMAMQFPASF